MMLYFIHGLNGNAKNWKKYIDFLNNHGFQCHSVDLKKGLNLRKTHFNDYIEKVCEIVSSDDVIIGHSMGGLIMQKVLEQKKVKAGIGICPASPTGIKFSTMPWYSQIRYIPYILFGVPFKPSFGWVKNNFVPNINEKTQRKIYQHMQKQSSHVTYEVIKHKIPVDEQKISSPLYFIGRKNDTTIPLDVVKKIAEKYNADCDIVDGNHYIFINWKPVAEKILLYLKNLENKE